MEDQDNRTEDSEDVEAHRRRAQFQASEEAKDEAEGEGDDVEAHRRKAKLQASEEAQDEAEGGDDFELHGKNKPKAL